MLPKLYSGDFQFAKHFNDLFRHTHMSLISHMTWLTASIQHLIMTISVLLYCHRPSLKTLKKSGKLAEKALFHEPCLYWKKTRAIRRKITSFWFIILNSSPWIRANLLNSHIRVNFRKFKYSIFLIFWVVQIVDCCIKTCE